MLSQCVGDCSPPEPCLTHGGRGEVLLPKMWYFTKARQGLEKCLEILPMPDGLGWKISQFEYEGEMKSKENETKNSCVKGPSITRLGVTNRMKKVTSSFEWWGGSGSLAQNLPAMREMNSQLPLERGWRFSVPRGEGNGSEYHGLLYRWLDLPLTSGAEHCVWEYWKG